MSPWSNYRILYLRHDSWGLAGFQLLDFPLALAEPLVAIRTGKNDEFLMICSRPWKNYGWILEAEKNTGGFATWTPLVHRWSVWLWTPELNQQQYVLIGSSGFDSKIGFLLLWCSMISSCLDKEKEGNDLQSICLHSRGRCRFCMVLLGWIIDCTISNRILSAAQHNPWNLQHENNLCGRRSPKNDGL